MLACVMKWSPGLSRDKMVDEIAAMPLATTTAASVPSNTAILPAKTCEGMSSIQAGLNSKSNLEALNPVVDPPAKGLPV